VALAEGVGGSMENFVAMMNRQAQAWGLKNTQFKNASGLTEPGHYSSARDVATVAAHIINEHPEFYKLYSLRDYTYNNIKQDNRNMLLGRDPSVDGMKTGYTETAGYCLVASAARDTPAGKRRLLSVVLGTASREARASESQKLLNWGWSAWDAVRLFEADKPVATVRCGRATSPRCGWAPRARCSSPCPRAKATSSRPPSNAPTRWSPRWWPASAWAASRSPPPAVPPCPPCPW
jgi:D-alanyl-D-alanine carboxypeptidase (penicillin-binding protein 5/6)